MRTVTAQALAKRINRRWAAEGRATGWPPKVLRKSRPRELWDLGEWHVVDTQRNMVVDTHIHQAARLMGVMQDREVLA
jgi:hypothetical protein